MASPGVVHLALQLAVACAVKGSACATNRQHCGPVQHNRDYMAKLGIVLLAPAGSDGQIAHWEIAGLGGQGRFGSPNQQLTRRQQQWSGAVTQSQMRTAGVLL